MSIAFPDLSPFFRLTVNYQGNLLSKQKMFLAIDVAKNRKILLLRTGPLEKSGHVTCPFLQRPIYSTTAHALWRNHQQSAFIVDFQVNPASHAGPVNDGVSDQLVIDL